MYKGYFLNKFIKKISDLLCVIFDIYDRFKEIIYHFMVIKNIT